MFEFFSEAAEERKRRAVKIAVVAVLLLGGFFIARYLLLPPVSSHRGDGTFQDISWFAGPFPIRGYSVTMPELDLGSPLELEYRLADLPNIGLPCGVYLAIRDHDDGLWRDTKKFDGKLRLELLDSRSLPVVDVSGRLGDFIWWGFDDLHALYQMDRSFFTPDTDEEYRLRLTYTPIQGSRDIRGPYTFIAAVASRRVV
jgi:hypothetical protein